MKSLIIFKSSMAAALLLPLGVNAMPIEGEIGFTGALLPTCSTEGNECSLVDAIGLDFINDAGLVVFATGSFTSAVAFGDSASMNDFVFAPFGSGDTLWSVGGFNIALETLIIVFESSTALALTGTGHVFSDDPGLDPTMVNWSFSADTVPGASAVSWSSTATAVIPVPAALWLMIGAGGALIGFRRKA